MIASELVSHIMTKHVISVNIKDHLRHVIDLIKKEKIRHLPVVDGDQIKGIISSTDLNRLTFSNLFDQQDNSEDAILDMLSIDQVMHTHPMTVNSNNTIKEVAEIFANHHFHALPVMEENRLVGIVTTTDIIKFLLKQLES